MKKLVNGKEIEMSEAEIAAMQPTPYQLAVEEWGNMDFAHKVIAPVALNDTYPSIVTWAILNPKLMELDTRGELVHVLFNNLRDEHAELIKDLGLEILNRPTK